MDDLETAVRATSDFELFDAVCQAATIHACEEVEEASLRRRLAIDQLLVRNGRAPAMLPLTGADALAVGNEFTRLLVRQWGRDKAMRLVGSTEPLDPYFAAELGGLLSAATGPQLIHDDVLELEGDMLDADAG